MMYNPENIKTQALNEKTRKKKHNNLKSVSIVRVVAMTEGVMEQGRLIDGRP